VYGLVRGERSETYSSHGARRTAAYPTTVLGEKNHEAYKALPAKVAQQVLLLLERNWKSFFEALDSYRTDPRSFADARNHRNTSTKRQAAMC